MESENGEDLRESESYNALEQSFWVVRVPSAVFSDQEEKSLKPEFETVFRVYSESCQFKYLKSFGRVQVIYPSAEQAKLAQDNLRNHEFCGEDLKMCPIKPIQIGDTSLSIPERTKQFLISPPTSPPVGWEQAEEAKPRAMVDFSLVTALAKLQLPGDIQELFEGSESQPSIVVVTPEDSSDADRLPTVLQNKDSNITNPRPIIMQTPRPPLK